MIINLCVYVLIKRLKQLFKYYNKNRISPLKMSLFFALVAVMASGLGLPSSANEINTSLPKASDPMLNLNHEGEVEYANCVMESVADAYLKKEGSFIDSYAVVVGCRCIAYSIQERASQEPCSQVASPGVISRKDARRHGLTNY